MQQHLFGAPGHARHVDAIAAAGVVAATVQLGAMWHVRFFARQLVGQVDDTRFWHATALDALHVVDHFNCKVAQKMCEFKWICANACVLEDEQ